MSEVTLSNYIDISKQAINPKLFLDENFYYYSLPDFDEGKKYSTTLGRDIESNKFIAANNSILISKLNPRIKRVWLLTNDENLRSITSTEFVVIKPKELAEILYLYYFLQSDYVYSKLQAVAIGTTNSHVRIKPDFLYRINADFPSIVEQQRTATILSKIDQAIEKTEALIEKYQQIKAGLMHDLFTRGIGADGKLRPPREEAPELYQQTVIGWIPKDWELVTCDDVCTKIIDCKNRTPPIYPDGHPVIRTPNVRNGLFVDAELVYTNDGSYDIWTARGKPEVGDIVITREAPVGEVCKIPARHSEACLGQRMMLYRTDSDVIENDFFLYALQSRQIQKRLDVISGGSTVGHVKVGDIRDLYMFLPNSDFEQERISIALNHACERIYSETAIREKLGKKKSGLMQDLLTGKVPVKVPTTEQATA